MSDAGLRRSEAAALVWENLEVWEDGFGRLTVRRSKSDRGPKTVYITPTAVNALNDIWPVDAAGGDSIFRLSAPDLPPKNWSWL